MLPNRFFLKLAWLLLLLFAGKAAQAFSVLTHQAMVDGAWQKAMVPLLQEKYPGITQNQLQEAHAYAYGGAIIQDMGYYPLGSRFFTDLTHYVRTGDFVNNLISEAQNYHEYAFALGALAHYYSDIHGHAGGTNPGVPLIYPKIRQHFGNVATFEDDPRSHTRTEFAFDVLQAARWEYTPEAFRNFIGFKVAEDQLERAFQKTYGLKLADIFVYLPLAEWVFRFSVKSLIPQFIKIGWHRNRNKIEKTKDQAVEPKNDPGLQARAFKKEFSENEKPGPSAKAMSLVFRVAPKVGPLSTLKFKLPTPKAESLFVQSFDHSLSMYGQGLLKLKSQPFLELPAYNLDTGAPTQINEYALSDAVHSRLLNRISRNDFSLASAILKTYLLNFYLEIPPPPDFRKEKKEYRQTQANLKKLKQHQASKP